MKHLAAFLSLILVGCRQLPKYDKESPEINIVPPNSKFRINLPEDHRTGYLWSLEQTYDNKVVHQINEVWHGNEKGVDFNLKTMASGQTTLTFIMRGYRDTADFKHFIVKIGSE
jgi:hypothetical protein